MSTTGGGRKNKSISRIRGTALLRNNIDWPPEYQLEEGCGFLSFHHQHYHHMTEDHVVGTTKLLTCKKNSTSM